MYSMDILFMVFIVSQFSREYKNQTIIRLFYTMGRKKIQIKLIKNDRLRNITYNKRKRGLLKKLVELSIMCGIKAKLEMKDSFGNLIVLDAGQMSPPEVSDNKEKVLVFTPADYPQFKGFQKIKKKGILGDSEQASVKQPSQQEMKPIESKAEGFRSCKRPLELVNNEKLTIKQQLAVQCPPPDQTQISQPPLSSQVDCIKQIQNLQAMQLQSQLIDYARLRYQSLLNAFINGQNI